MGQGDPDSCLRDKENTRSKEPPPLVYVDEKYEEQDPRRCCSAQGESLARVGREWLDRESVEEKRDNLP